MKTINNSLIRKFSPCYNPNKIVSDEQETLSVVEWVNKYRNKVNSKEDILWLLCRNEFLSDKDLRLFAVWCAREALKLVDNQDEGSINACNVAERFAVGMATSQDLYAARSAARSAAMYAAWDAARSAAMYAAWDAARDAAMGADRDADRDAAMDAQINKLLTYFND